MPVRDNRLHTKLVRSTKTRHKPLINAPRVEYYIGWKRRDDLGSKRAVTEPTQWQKPVLDEWTRILPRVLPSHSH
jgi:hypothetical protein